MSLYSYLTNLERSHLAINSVAGLECRSSEVFWCASFTQHDDVVPGFAYGTESRIQHYMLDNYGIC